MELTTEIFVAAWYDIKLRVTAENLTSERWRCLKQPDMSIGMDIREPRSIL